MISKNRLKYIRSLRNKKSRDEHGQFVAEGDKIVMDLIGRVSALGRGSGNGSGKVSWKGVGSLTRQGLTPVQGPGSGQRAAPQPEYPTISQLIITTAWLKRNPSLSVPESVEITEVSEKEYNQITLQESPAGIMAVLDTPIPPVAGETVPLGLSIALETIQDPGNLGTIIRTASWFGLQTVYCSEDCAECYNPKVVQSSMGAVLYTPVCYTPLPRLLRSFSESEVHTVYGTFMSGTNIWKATLGGNALIVLGNESRGISQDLLPFISGRLHIPPQKGTDSDALPAAVESLNVASAAAIVCAAFSMASYR